MLNYQSNMLCETSFQVKHIGRSFGHGNISVVKQIMSLFTHNFYILCYWSMDSCVFFVFFHTFEERLGWHSHFYNYLYSIIHPNKNHTHIFMQTRPVMSPSFVEKDKLYVIRHSMRESIRVFFLQSKCTKSMTCRHPSLLQHLMTNIVFSLEPKQPNAIPVVWSHLLVYWNG